MPDSNSPRPMGVAKENEAELRLAIREEATAIWQERRASAVGRFVAFAAVWMAALAGAVAWIYESLGERASNTAIESLARRNDEVQSSLESIRDLFQKLTSDLSLSVTRRGREVSEVVGAIEERASQVEVMIARLREEVGKEGSALSQQSAEIRGQLATLEEEVTTQGDHVRTRLAAELGSLAQAKSDLEQLRAGIGEFSADELRAVLSKASEMAIVYDKFKGESPLAALNDQMEEFRKRHDASALAGAEFDESCTAALLETQRVIYPLMLLSVYNTADPKSQQVARDLSERWTALRTLLMQLVALQTRRK